MVDLLNINFQEELRRKIAKLFKNFNALTNACYFSMLPFTINLFMARFLYASDTCKCFAATAIIIPNKILLSIRTLAKTSPTTNSNCIFFDFISTYIDEFIKFVYWMYLLGIFIFLMQSYIVYKNLITTIIRASFPRYLFSRNEVTI